MKLLVTLERDKTGTFVVECPSIPGCISQGKTEQEAIANIREAIVGCLETRAANQMPLPSTSARWKSTSDGPASVYLGSGSGRAFKCAGWLEDRQRGSHVILTKIGHHATLSQHRELAPGTLRALIRASGLSVEEFVALL